MALFSTFVILSKEVANSGGIVYHKSPCRGTHHYIILIYSGIGMDGGRDCRFMVGGMTMDDGDGQVALFSTFVIFSKELQTSGTVCITNCLAGEHVTIYSVNGMDGVRDCRLKGWGGDDGRRRRTSGSFFHFCHILCITNRPAREHSSVCLCVDEAWERIGGGIADLMLGV